ncbi:HAMP domain-containing histidine kinase [Nitriliruptoraceae bacterium ZYF776]|nr:HAMP domain-containing histidine kinase [Profundirhabdus halotolerans]
MNDARLEAIIDVLAQASVGANDVRVPVDFADVDDPLGLIGNAVNLLLEDLDQRRRGREEALEKVAAARAKQEFLSYLSHDMQTPLALLLGSLDLLDEDAGRDDLAATLPIMRQAVATLERFVQQFLDLARLEAERPLLVRREEVDLLALLERVGGLFADRGGMGVAIDGAVPAVTADPDRVEQIVANLVANAFKYAGRPRVLVHHTPGEARVSVTISDEGAGLDPEELTRVFEKFERGAVADRAGGSGLGLFISRALAEAQGGSLTAYSEPGVGSRFTLTLPVAAGPRSSEVVTAAPTERL